MVVWIDELVATSGLPTSVSDVASMFGAVVALVEPQALPYRVKEVL